MPTRSKSITYLKPDGTTVIATGTYTYDAAGRRMSVTGDLATFVQASGTDVTDEQPVHEVERQDLRLRQERQPDERRHQHLRLVTTQPTRGRYRMATSTTTTRVAANPGAGGLCAILLSIALAACSSDARQLAPGKDVQNLPAPDGTALAFVWKPDLDGLSATISQPYQVWVQDLSVDKSKELMFEADKTDGVQLTWRMPDVLEICYEKAQITSFHNYFVAATQNSPTVHKIEVVLRKEAAPGCPDACPLSAIGLSSGRRIA